MPPQYAYRAYQGYRPTQNHYPGGYVPNQIGPSWAARDPGLPRRILPAAPPSSPQQPAGIWYVLIQASPQWGNQERYEFRNAYDALYSNQNVIVSRAPNDLFNRRGVLVTVFSNTTNTSDVIRSAIGIMGNARGRRSAARSQVRRWPVGTQTQEFWSAP